VGVGEMVMNEWTLGKDVASGGVCEHVVYLWKKEEEGRSFCVVTFFEIMLVVGM
jgi:hypothetical protein